MDNLVLILAGPTASGKSAAALDIAAKKNAVIINCDSKQVYREIPIITAQPSKEEQEQIRHKLYGYVSVADNFSTFSWAKDAVLEIEQCFKNNQLPLLVGGTGMYIKTLIEGMSPIPDIKESVRAAIRSDFENKGLSYIYGKLQKEDEESAKNLNEKDTQRILRALEVVISTGKPLSYWHKQKPKKLIENVRFLKIFYNPDREVLYQRANERFVKMLGDGILEEVDQIRKMQLDPFLPAMRAHGVPEVIAYLEGNMTKQQMIDKSQQNTRNYIKRQITWFKHQWDDFIEINHFDPQDEIIEFL